MIDVMYISYANRRREDIVMVITETSARLSLISIPCKYSSGGRGGVGVAQDVGGP